MSVAAWVAGVTDEIMFVDNFLIFFIWIYSSSTTFPTSLTCLM